MTERPPAQLLRIDPDEYHQRPGFSSTIAKELVERSPLHAWSKHPLYGGKGKKPTKEMDFGQVVHTLSLGKGKRFEVLEFGDYRKDVAKEARDAARAQGRVPVLRKDYDRAVVVASRLTAQLAERGLKLEGESEIAIEWTELTEHGPVLCRAMFDHLIMGGGSAAILDLKITGNAAPSFIERNAENMGYAIQEAAYRRALTALEPDLAGRIDFLFAFCEADEPFAINPVRGDGLFRELGEQRWQRALNTWAECVANNKWPAYGAGVNQLSAPAWALAREEYAA